MIRHRGWSYIVMPYHAMNGRISSSCSNPPSTTNWTSNNRDHLLHFSQCLRTLASSCSGHRPLARNKSPTRSGLYTFLIKKTKIQNDHWSFNQLKALRNYFLPWMAWLFIYVQLKVLIINQKASPFFEDGKMSIISLS